MNEHILPIAKLINAFRKLPGVGQKVATRFAYAVVEMTDGEADEFAAALFEARDKTLHCSLCGGYAEEEVCAICARRDRRSICVVAYPKDILNMERMHSHDGVYFVLGGVLKPSEGIGEEELRFAELRTRVQEDGVIEVIVATNPDYSGDATAYAVARLLAGLPVRVTRLAQGISIGTDLDYADEVTLSRAFFGRSEL